MSKNGNIAGLLISAAVFAGSCAQIISKAGAKDIAITTISVPENNPAATVGERRPSFETADKNCTIPVTVKKEAAPADDCSARK